MQPIERSREAVERLVAPLVEYLRCYDRQALVSLQDAMLVASEPRVRLAFVEELTTFGLCFVGIEIVEPGVFRMKLWIKSEANELCFSVYGPGLLLEGDTDAAVAWLETSARELVCLRGKGVE